jgi:hypothetical protein
MADEVTERRTLSHWLGALHVSVYAYAAPVKDRSIWPECRKADTHGRCSGSTATSECICWHHVLRQRQADHAVVEQREVEQAHELIVQIERKLESIGARRVSPNAERQVEDAHELIVQIERKLESISARQASGNAAP